MATYFALTSSNRRIRSLVQADRLALSMIRRIEALNARVVAVKGLGDEGFVFSLHGRNLRTGAVVSALRQDPGMTPFRISEEAVSVEGPLLWKKSDASSNP